MQHATIAARAPCAIRNPSRPPLSKQPKRAVKSPGDPERTPNQRRVQSGRGAIMQQQQQQQLQQAAPR
eukprot:9727439-Alexandrium_andersonii.AAC.1